MWQQQMKQNWIKAKIEYDDPETASEFNLATLLTEAQCQQIVNEFNKIHGTDLKYTQHKISTAVEAKGFLGEYFHLFVLCDVRAAVVDLPELTEDQQILEDSDDHDKPLDQNTNTAVLKFFIKKLPFVHEDDERIMIFRKESLLYSLLFPKLQKYAPLAWFPEIYLSTNTLLVFQDLTELGYRALTFKDNLDESEMLPILKGLAAMHASSLLYEIKNEKCVENFASDYLKEITIHPEIPWFTTGLKALLDIARHHSKYQTEVSQEFINKELPHHLKSILFMVNPSPRYRNVVCHRDTWGGNIFINPEDTETSAIFVDFQTCRYCPPAIDVIFALFLNLSREERLERQTEYLQYYWAQLQDFISNEIDAEDWDFNESEFLESYAEFQLFGLVYRALAMTLIKVPNELVNDDYKNVERSEKLLEYMKEDEKFCLLMEECMEDVIETVINNFIKSDTD